MSKGVPLKAAAMQRANTCPSVVELQRFVSGDTVLDEQVATHLDHCKACQNAADAMARNEELANWARELRDHAETRSENRKDEMLVRIAANVPTFIEESDSAPLPTIPGFELLEQIGHGGMGVVYRARDVVLGRDFAIKFLRYEVGATPTERKRFRKEAEAAASLTHDHILKVYPIGEANGRPYLIMELTRGGTLRDKIRDRSLVLRDAVSLLAKIASAVHYIHEAGITHRDLKPSNILFTEEGIPKVADFGLAKRSSDTQLTGSYDLIGTIEYLAPERISGTSIPAPSMDIYALGVILYQFLTGNVPFTSLATGDLLLKIRNEEPVEPSKINPAAPRALEAICLKCLAKLPEQRYRTAQEMADELNRWLDGEKILTPSVGRLMRIYRWGLRNRLATAFIVLLVLTTMVATLAGILKAQAEAAVAKQRDAEQGLREGAERERDNERRLRQEVEASKHHVSTLLTQYDLAEMRRRLTVSEMIPRANQLVDLEPTLSWDNAYLEHAMELRPQHQQRWVSAAWGAAAAAIAPDSGDLAIAHSDGTIVVWNTKTRERKRVLQQPDIDPTIRRTWPFALANRAAGQNIEWVTGLAWLPSGERLAACSTSGKGIVYDVAAGSASNFFEGESPLTSLAASHDGKQVLLGDMGGGLHLHSFTNEKAVERKLNLEKSHEVSVILWLESISCWCVGSASGEVYVLDSQTLATVASTSVVGPIWSLAATRQGSELSLFVGGEDSLVSHFRYEIEPQQFRLVKQIPLRAITAHDNAAHALRVSEDGKRLWLVDMNGTLVDYDLTTSKVRWNRNAVMLDTRRNKLESELKRQSPSTDVPLAFRRMAAALLPRDTSSFFVIGDDGLVSVWPVVPGREAIHLGTKVHEKVVGRNSRIAFSRSDHELLWCLDGEANLKVVDATSGTVKGRQEKAHANSAKGTVGDLAVLPSGGAVTVGGDTRMRFWSWSGDSIVSEGESIEHKKPLISVAASDNGRWVAAVDSQSGVAIWRVADRVQQFYQESPSLHEQPHTGDCAFNRSATRFAAFGAGQTALVFDCRDDDGRLVVRRMPDQLNVAGTRGGTALHWSPIDQNRIAHADDDRRFQFINWTSDERREKPGPVVDSPVIAIDSTPDLRRVLYVTQAGLLGSYDARHEILMAEFSSSLTDVCTMSIDPSGNRVALANSAGSLEIWHSAAQTVDLPVSLVDETELWKGRDWLQRDSAIVKLPWRPIKVDETGNAHVLVTEAQPSAFRSDAALYLVYEDGEKMTRERITVGQAEFDDRMTVEACALELRAGQPVVAFRCRTAERSPYDGQLVLAKRVAQGKWEREWIEREGNMGFSPQIAFNAAGEVRELFHFSFDGYYLTHSHRTADVWQSKFVGQQGDGRLLDARFDSGVLHLFSDSNRYNGDPVQGVYMRWEAGKEMVREQLPLDRSFQRQISTLPNGEPVVMERIEAYPECRLWHRGESGWRVRQSIPRFICLNSTAWEIGPDGATYVVAWDPTGKRLVLWRGIGDDWKGSVISTKLPSSPNWLWIGFDHEQLPLLVAGEQRIPFAWLRAFRRH